MRLRWGLYLAILAAPSIGAATIDVSAETSAVVHTGDTLVFHLLTWNFGVNAAAFGLPEYPTEVNFALVSAPRVRRESSPPRWNRRTGRCRWRSAT